VSDRPADRTAAASERIDQLEQRVRELEAELSEVRARELRVPADQALHNIRSLPIIVFRVDPNGIILESVGRGLQRLGLEERQAVGTNIFDAFPEVADNIRRAQRGEDVFFEASGTYEGRPWASINHYSLHRVSGDVVAVALDVTPLREMRGELEVRERLFQALADTVPVGIVRIDRHGKCTYLNKRVREALGIGECDPSTFDWMQHVHADDRERAREQWSDQHVVANGTRVTYRMGSGDQERWLQAQTVLERDAEGNPAG
jgi:PAS domain S-box-containing protein